MALGYIVAVVATGVADWDGGEGGGCGGVGESRVGDKGVSGVRVVGEGSGWDIVGLVRGMVRVRARVWV